MRIAFTNPDTMGDLILRQPMYQALGESGHELLLLVRPEFFPIVRYIAPNAAVLEIPFNPYAPVPKAKYAAATHSLTKRVEDWQPDMLAFASWQWTFFDEWLSSQLPGVPLIGHTGRCAGEVSGLAHGTFFRQIETEIDLHEIEKNRRMAEALGASVPGAQRPTIQNSTAASAQALEVLKQVGLEPGSYWIVVVGEKANRSSHLRNWSLDRWSAVLLHGIREHGWHFLLTGTPDELAAARQIRDLAGSPSEIVLQESPVDIDTLIGLTAFSQGYIGRDTGPMHLAAALDRPLLALFGGGHWPRFTPVATMAIALTMDVPCTRCEWNCDYSDSHCIKEIPVEMVTSAMDDLANGVAGLEVRVLERTQTTTSKMEREVLERLKTERVLQNELRTRVEGLRTELELCHQQNQELLASRWRKLGSALGLTKRLSSKLAG